jgi:hypothetical protein
LRIELLAVGPIQDEAVIHFHSRLTVVGGVEVAQRAELIDLIVGGVSGRHPDVRSARWIDSTGIPVLLTSGPSGPLWSGEDGALTDSLLAVFGLDEATIRRLMILSADDLGVVRASPPDEEGPELADARAALATMDEELAQALGVRARVDTLRAEVISIDQRIRAADADDARRRYTLLLAELNRVRVEADSIRGGVKVADDDRRFIAAGSELQTLSDRWRHARDNALLERQRFASRERLDTRTLNEALVTPEHVPPELDALAAAYEEAEARRAMLSERLNSLAASALPEPSHPGVVRLAHSGQEEVWATARRALEAGSRLEEQSLALGGIVAEGVASSAASELETAHDAVELAEREMRRRRVPGTVGAVAGLLVAVFALAWVPILAILGLLMIGAIAVWAVVIPGSELRTRRTEEADALHRAGVPAYITFQLRRLDVHIEPKATEPLEIAALEYRRAQAAWRKLAGDLGPAEALELEEETRRYTASLAGSQGAVQEIADLRHKLATEAEPAVARARYRLVEACAPFGIDDPRLAVDLVRRQASTSGHARLQAVLETAEQAEVAARTELERKLDSLGFGPSPTPGVGIVPADDAELERRLDAFDQARARGEERNRARGVARPVQEVEADLARLEAQVAAAGRPEWSGGFEPTETGDADVEQLQLRRQQLFAEYQVLHGQLPDIGRMTDRRDAIERRIAVLVADAEGPPQSLGIADLEHVLLARLAAARRIGPRGESVTVLLDEPFERIHGERKSGILDAVERLSASVQIVYLSNDVDVLVWARRRGAGGAVTLLEPSPEPAI